MKQVYPNIKPNYVFPFCLILLFCLSLNDNSLYGQCTCTEGDFGFANPKLICENFESYNNNVNFPINNSRWAFRPGTSTYGKIQYAPNSTNKALYMTGNGSSPSLLLKLGNKTTGRYRVSWQMYIPKGKTASYNFQHAETADYFAFEIVFGANGIGSVNRLKQTPSRFPYLMDAWNKVAHIVDLNTDELELWINDEFVDSWKFSCGVEADTKYCFIKAPLVAVNFHAGSNAAFYVDDICMWESFNPPSFPFPPVCLKNGQSYPGGTVMTRGLYTAAEILEGECPDICSFAGLNVKNSLKYSNGTKIPASKITNESTLPNSITSIPCLKELFIFDATSKQLRGQVYPFTATTNDLYVDLIFQSGMAGDVQIALIECNGTQNYTCSIDQKSDGNGHVFKVQAGKTYVIVLVAIREVEFLIDISTEDLPKECYEIIRPKSYAPSCLCQEFESALSTSTTLVNVKTGFGSLSSRVFPEIGKNYLGGEKSYRIIVDQPSVIDLTLSSTNQGYCMFLAGSECDDNLLALAETSAKGGSASFRRYLEAGVYHIIIDQLELDPNSAFGLVYAVSPANTVLANNQACPVDQSSSHQVSIRANPLLLDGDVMTTNDRIYLLNPRNKENREANAANWNSLELKFTLYGDKTSDLQECGYREGEQIQFAVVRQDKIYYVRPVFQPQDEITITGNNQFKPGATSLITGFISELNVANLGVSSIPNLNANEKSFTVEVNSNQHWRIQRVNPNKALWVNISPAEATGIQDVFFTVAQNSNTQARADTFLVINDQGFYKTLIINQPGCTGPSVNAGLDRNVCPGENFTLMATGMGMLTWQAPGIVSNPSFNTAINATQTFTAYATIGGCSASDQITVNVWPKPIANAGPDQTICVGDKAVLTASGGGNYLWSANNNPNAQIEVSPTQTQTYTVTVTQNECEAIDRVTVIVNANPSIKKDSSQFKAGPKSFIAISVTGGASPYQYQWFRNDTLISTQEDLLGLKTGTYTLAVSDANGCTATYGPESFIITSSRDFADFLSLKIYPNPTQGTLRIEGEFQHKETVQVKILDAIGKYIWQSDVKNANAFLYTPDLYNLAKGIYIIQFDVSGGLVYRKLIVH